MKAGKGYRALAAVLAILLLLQAAGAGEVRAEEIPEIIANTQEVPVDTEPGGEEPEKEPDVEEPGEEEPDSGAAGREEPEEGFEFSLSAELDAEEGAVITAGNRLTVRAAVAARDSDGEESPYALSLLGVENFSADLSDVSRAEVLADSMTYEISGDGSEGILTVGVQLQQNAAEAGEPLSITISLSYGGEGDAEGQTVSDSVEITGIREPEPPDTAAPVWLEGSSLSVADAESGEQLSVENTGDIPTVYTSGGRGVVITLPAAQDEEAGSGISGYFYTVDAEYAEKGAAEKRPVSKGSLVFAEGGTHTLYFYAEDKAGNISVPLMVRIVSDQEGPSVEVADRTAEEGVWTSHPYHIALRASDENSVKALSYYIQEQDEEGGVPEYSAETMTAEGEEAVYSSEQGLWSIALPEEEFCGSVYVCARDMAGNETVQEIKGICIDRTDPVISVEWRNADGTAIDPSEPGAYYQRGESLTAVISVRERYLDPNGTYIYLTALDGQGNPAGGEAQNINGKTWARLAERYGVTEESGVSALTLSLTAEAAYTLSVKAADRAGNRAEAGETEILLDRSPAAFELLGRTAEENEWTNEENYRLTFRLTDESGTAGVWYYVQRQQTDGTVPAFSDETMQKEGRELSPGQDGSYTVTLSEEDFRGCVYLFSRDFAGNEGRETVGGIQIDGIDPDTENLYFEYEADTDTGGWDSFWNGVFGKEAIAVKVYVRDPGSFPSGIAELSFRCGGQSFTVNSFGEASLTAEQVKDPAAAGLYQLAEVSLDVKKDKLEDQLLEITDLKLKDLAGNTAEGEAELLKGGHTLIIDRTAPKLTVKAESGYRNGFSADERWYFKDAAVFRLTVEEKWFDQVKDRLHLELAEGETRTPDTGFGAAMKAEDPEKGIYETVYTLTEEGSWQLRIGAYPEFSGTEPSEPSEGTGEAAGYDTSVLGGFSDPAGNLMTGGENTEVQSGVYTGPQIVIDKTAPEAGLQWKDADGRPFDPAESGSYYQSGDGLSVTLAVKELYLDTEDTRIWLEARDGSGAAVSCEEVQKLNGKSWEELSRQYGGTHENGVYTLTLPFSTEAAYTLSVLAKDKAGNEAETLSTAVFLDRSPVRYELMARTAGEGVWTNAEDYELSFRLADESGTESVKYYVQVQAEDGTVPGFDLETLNQKGQELKPEKDGTYRIVLHEEDFQGSVYIRTRDRAGNEKTEEIKGIFIDGKDPDPTHIYFGYEAAEEQGLLHQIANTIFGKTAIRVKIYARDPGTCPSGIRRLVFTYAEKEYTLTESLPVTLEAQGSVEGGEYQLFEQLLNVRDSELEEEKLRITELVMTDGAGNAAEAEEAALANGSILIIDTTAPRLGVSTEAEHLEGYENDESLYYAGSVPFDLTVSERYFSYVQDRMHLELEKDGRLTADTKLGRTLTAASAEDERNGLYRGQYLLTEEGVYRFRIGSWPEAGAGGYDTSAALGAFSDGAGNILEGLGDTAVTEGFYMSPVIIIDRTAPEVSFRWLDAEGQEISGEEDYYQSGEFLTLELAVAEPNLDMEATRLWLEAADIRGAQVPCGEVDSLNGKTWAELSEDLGGTFEDGVHRLTLRLETEAHYTLSMEVRDKAGNYASFTGQEQDHRLDLGSCCLDRTAPELADWYDSQGKPAGDITYEAKEQNFIEKLINGVTFGCFCKPEMTVRMQARDLVSGVGELWYRYEVYYEDGETGKTVEGTASLQNGMLKRDGADPSVCFMEITLPESFRGTFTVRAADRAGTVMPGSVTTRGIVSETTAMHEKTSSAEVSVVDGTAKREGFYRGDVTIQFVMKDGFSGIRNAFYQAGSQEERQSFEEKGREIVTELSYRMTIHASENNRNEIPIQGILTDFAGHTAGTAGMPEVHIDTVTPQVSVSWDNEEVLNEKYYKADRTALITVTERNFDPEDVQLEITGMDTPGLSWSHHGGGGCSGSGDPYDLGHTDSCSWTAEVVFDQDGEYSFGFSCRDSAGNEGSYGETEEFVIDKTAPVLSVSWNGGSALNGNYYGEARSAQILITEKNFREEDVIAETTATDRGQRIAAPRISGFSGNGDEHRALVDFDYDGVFMMELQYTDLAGNEAEIYTEEEFVVDLTAPEAEFFDIENHSANNGTVAPGLRIADTNYDMEGIQVQLLGSGGGLREMPFSRSAGADGVTLKWRDFEHVPENDDLYRLTASITDLAGNVTETELLFSVNRFGSVYVLDAATEQLAGRNGSYYTSQEQDIVIEEYNVDTLEFGEVSYSRDGQVVMLQEGRDYTVTESGGEDSWKTYRYQIAARNFSGEGTYVVTVYSKDRAENVSSNRIKEKSIEFAVDKTTPSVVVTGVEDNGRYRSDSREIRIDIQDNIALSQAEIWINDEKQASFDRAQLQESRGQLVFRVPGSGDWQTLMVRAEDEAGNRQETEELRFLVTSSAWIQFVRNGRAMTACVCGGLVLIPGCILITVHKKNKQKHSKQS
ncbi:MAG: Ig-like domain repeat protein [Candidatus Merdisoma sp.]|jgi:hypothetical protein